MSAKTDIEAQVAQRLAELREQRDQDDAAIIRADLAAREAERQRLVQAAEALVEAQEAAMEAHRRGSETAAQLIAQIERVAEMVRELIRLKETVDRGVHFEQFAIRDGYLQRPTIAARFPVKPESITLLITAAKALCRVTQSSWEMADIKAGQKML
jgi:hypothetical protein